MLIKRGDKLPLLVFGSRPLPGFRKLAVSGISRICGRKPCKLGYPIGADVGKAGEPGAKSRWQSLECCKQALMGGSRWMRLLAGFKNPAAIFDDCRTVFETDIGAQGCYLGSSLAGCENERDAEAAKPAERRLRGCMGIGVVIEKGPVEVGEDNQTRSMEAFHLIAVQFVIQRHW